MKKLLAIILTAALLVFGTTAGSLSANDDKDDILSIPTPYSPMPY